MFLPLLCLYTSLAVGVSAQADQLPATPTPEPIKLTKLPLPPAIDDDATPGACNSTVNPKGTGCTGKTSPFAGGSFLPDGNHVLVQVTFLGSEENSIYNGTQIIAVKTTGNTFSNGDPWKCLTCGIDRDEDAFEYPQTFHDGKRALAGTKIIDCGKHDLMSDECTPEKTHIYPIRWNTSPDGSGDGGPIRELRLHPDNVHLGFNSFTNINGKLGQYGYLARLSFNPSPEAGSPLGPRYDLLNVTRLFDPADIQTVEAKGDQLVVNPNALAVGEFRGFSGDGKEVTYVGYPTESSNIDVFAADLATGAVRRLTSHPEYVDPIDFSPDNQWFVIMDTRGTDRQMWLSGMRNVPPITDLISTSATSSTRNNGRRRFFYPYLLDRYGDRGDYYGQRINDRGSGVPGSGDFNDPEWNARADPRWSPDGTQIMYWEEQALSPACGGDNPLPCYPSKEPYGRAQRVIIATLTDRKPHAPQKIEPISDFVPWGVPYVPGSETPARPEPSPGNYTLKGKAKGYAKVELRDNPSIGALNYVQVDYFDFSDDGKTSLNGTESVMTRMDSATETFVDWRSDLVQISNDSTNTKKTGPDGFQLRIDILKNIFNANGTLTTEVDGKVYKQPANGT
ncbi:hypothetical protein FDECE_1740 [Fusarium decemcellulare]|nr:hypothetical protein FDECE_1740 [Fusarium decemcellulare]